MSEEEKQAIESLRKNRGVSFAQADIILNLIDKQQKEIEEKTTIIMAGAEKVKQLEKEIKELKERLSIRKEQQETILVEKIKTLREEKIELIHDIEEREKILKKEIKSLLKEIEELKEENIELSNQITDGYWENDRLRNEIEKQQKEIEELKKENFDTVYIQAIENYKDKIREKIKELEKAKESIIEKTNSEVNVTGLSMQIEVLKELLEE